MKKIISLLLCIAWMLPQAISAHGSHHYAADADAHQQKLMLIINSNHDDEPWANEMAMPVLLKLAQIDSVSTAFISLNNTLIKNAEQFHMVEDNLFDTYSENKPSYVVLIGSFAFNLRKRIKAEWGDIPILLLSRYKEYAPLEDYFSKEDEPFEFNTLRPLSECREDYNFTLIYMPDYYKSTIDLMAKMLPDMKQLVLLSDNIYVNRRLAFNVINYLQTQYPHLEFRWLRASEESADSMRQLLANEDPETGILLSSWAFERLSSLGSPELTSTDLRLVSGSKNPIFALRDSYKVHGTIGGVYSDAESIDAEIDKIIDAMLAGKSMHDIPFYLNEKKLTKLNYRLLSAYGLDEAKAPEETEFMAKPQPFFQRYIVEICIVTFVVFVIVALLLLKNHNQQRQIKLLNRNKKFINNMPVPFSKAALIRDKNNKIISIKYQDMNEAFDALINVNAIEGSPYKLFPQHFISEKVNEMLSTKEIIKFTYHFEKTNTYYDFQICPSGDDNTGIKQFSKQSTLFVDIFASEITHRHLMEENLKILAEKLDLTLEIAKVVPWQLNFIDDTVIFRPYNFYIHHYGKLLDQKGGFEENEITVPLADFLTYIMPDDRNIIVKNYDDIKAGVINDFYTQYRTRNDDDPNAVEWLEIIGAVTERDENGKPLRLTGAVQVITDRKRQEEEMEAAIERANESDRMKSAFLANMSHEIRTPLNAIVGFSNLMATIQDENERAEFVDIINRNNDLLLNLINDVLDFAKIESNTIDFNYTMCDVNEIIKSVKQTMAMRIPKDVRFNAIVGAEECKIMTDTNRLTQLLINLISNACKFTTHGNITFGYEIHADDKLYFFVKDSGIGISEEKQKTVFQRFVKLNNFVQGTGLGLSICKSIVEKMGGEIGVRSAGEGKGSIFWFTIPYKPEEVQGIIEKSNDEKHETESINKLLMAGEKGAEKPNMLIAEDNPSNYRLMQHLLSDKFKLTWVQNGQEAVDAFKNDNFDIVLLDISMPVMDGYEALREIRKISETVPVIAVTAYAYASDRKRMLDNGFNAYVSKPISFKALKEAIKQSLS